MYFKPLRLDIFCVTIHTVIAFIFTQILVWQYQLAAKTTANLKLFLNLKEEYRHNIADISQQLWQDVVENFIKRNNVVPRSKRHFVRCFISHINSMSLLYHVLLPGFSPFLLYSTERRWKHLNVNGFYPSKAKYLIRCNRRTIIILLDLLS